MAGGAEGLKIVRIRIRSHINLNFILQQSLTAFGGAPFAPGSLSRYHAFGLLNKPKFVCFGLRVRNREKGLFQGSA